MEIGTFDYVLNLTSEKTQEKWKNCHPIAQEERLVPTLWHAEIIFVPVRSNIFVVMERPTYTYVYFLRTFIR
jgi:hypothetical protein